MLLIHLSSLSFISDVLACATVTQETTTVGNVLCCDVLTVYEQICRSVCSASVFGLGLSRYQIFHNTIIMAKRML